MEVCRLDKVKGKIAKRGERMENENIEEMEERKSKGKKKSKGRNT